MRRLRALLIGAVLVLCVLRAPALATNQSPTQSYCASWGVLSGALLRNWEAPLALAAGCGIQFGDLFTDGPLFNPTPGLSSLTFTVPANTWIAQGQKVVVTSSTNLSMTNNSNNWVWLDCNACSGTAQGTFEATTSSSPPHAYSTLMYVVVASGGSIISYTPTFINTLLASGFLQVYGTVATGVNQAVIAATSGITTCCQLELYTANTNSSVGTTPIRVMDDATDCVTGASKVAFDIFNHNSASLLTIGCSDTGSIFDPTVKTGGNMVVGGAFTDNTSIENGGLPQSSNSAICGSSTAVETNCFAGLPAPLATATPVQFTDSATATTSNPHWDFESQDGQCTEAGTHQNGYIFRIRNDTPTDIFHETCWGEAVFSNTGATNTTSVAAFVFQMVGSNLCDATHGSTDLAFQLLDDSSTNIMKATCGGGVTFNQVNATALKISGLGGTVLPIVGSNSGNVANGNVGGYLATPNPGPTTSTATGTSANTYQQSQTSSVTLGTSYGSQGKWYGVVEADFWVDAGTASAPVYGCIESSSTVTTITQTNAGDSSDAVCRGTPSGMMAGTFLFGTTTTPAYEEGITQHARWTGTALNGASLTFTTNVAGTSTTSISVKSSFSSYWIPI